MGLAHDTLEVVESPQFTNRACANLKSVESVAKLSEPEVVHEVELSAITGKFLLAHVKNRLRRTLIMAEGDPHR